VEKYDWLTVSEKPMQFRPGTLMQLLCAGCAALEIMANVSKRVLAGVDIGGTKTAVVLSSEPPRILGRDAFPTEPERGPEPAIRRIVDVLRSMLKRHGDGRTELAAIGISCGGPLDPDRGIIQSPPNLNSWDEVPISSILEAEFGVPCFLENDANAGALAEFRFGAGRGTKNMIFLTMGTGLGAGLILNGQIYRGASQTAGEIGHVRLTRTGPIGHGKAGTAEGWASGGGMAQVARAFVEASLARNEPTLLARMGDGLPELITARDVAVAARKGDRVATAVVQKVGEKLGHAMAILVDVLNPECIVVGGLALRFGEEILSPARGRMMKEALPAAVSHCRLVPAGLGEEIGDVAALCVAVDGLKRRGAEFNCNPPFQPESPTADMATQISR
jgi:glucokinase